MLRSAPRRLLAALLGLAVTLAPASAQAARNPDAHDLGAGRLALQGYDPVAYFDEGGAAPRQGKPELSLDHAGAVYRFASEEHQARFQADPARFEPAHGGWCSYAMSLGKQVSVDPRAFRVSEGRLLLFADAKSVQVDGKWVPREHELLGKADANWKRLSGESPRLAPAGSFRKYREFNLTEDSLALEGFDPVSYFPEGGSRPREGDAKFALRHRGVQYHFVSAANRARFAADPARYEPQHGGWCSYAMGASGEKVEVDPEAYRLTDGQLHLFYVGWFADTRDDWDDDTTALKRDADRKWDALLAAARPGA